jgi:hypothetical protein
MDPTPRHHAAEADFRRLLTSGGLAQPDRADYFSDSIVFRWSEQQLAVVFELSPPPPGHRLES